MSRVLIAVAASLALHAALAVVPALRGRRAAAAVTVEVKLTHLPARRVRATPTPPPPQARPPSRAKLAPRAKARRVQQLVMQRRPSKTDEKPAPEPRPLGVTPSSVAPDGEGAGQALPIGSGDGQAGGRGTARGQTPPGAPPMVRPAPPPTLRARPHLLREHKVPYPEEARRQGIEGTVQLDVLVGEDGRVREARVISGPGFGLNEAAQRALARFVFQPAMYSDGKPRPFRIVYRYVFQIDL